MRKITIYREESAGKVAYFLNDLEVAVLQKEDKAVKGGWAGWSFGAGGATDSLLCLGKFHQLYSMFFRGQEGDYDFEKVQSDIEFHVKAMRRLFRAEDPMRKIRKLTNTGALYMLNGVTVAQVYDWRNHPLPENQCVTVSRPSFIEGKGKGGFLVTRKFKTMEEAYESGKRILLGVTKHLSLGEELGELF